MKIRLGLLALCLCLLLAPAAAVADVAWEPDNSFYWKHMEDCVYENRTYYVQGECKLLEKPGGRGTIHMADQEEVFILFVYEDRSGDKWGVCEKRNENGQWDSGWLPMDALLLKYDNISFMQENAAKIRDGSEELEGLEFSADSFFTWTYPNSGEHMGLVETVPEQPVLFSALYTDELGREWAYCTYYFAWRDFWVCLDDPKEEELQLAAPPPVTPSASAQSVTAKDPPADRPASVQRQLLLPICLTAGVVVLTAALLLAIFIPRRKRK